jgi:hypothetical protein
MAENDSSGNKQNEPVILKYMTGLESFLVLFLCAGLVLLFFGGLLWLIDPSTKYFSQWMVYFSIPLLILSALIFQVKSVFLFDPLRNGFFIQRQIFSGKEERFISSLKDIKAVDLIHREPSLEGEIDVIRIQIVLSDNKKLCPLERSGINKGAKAFMNFLPLEELVDRAFTIASMAGCPVCCDKQPYLQEVVAERQKKTITVSDKCPSCDSVLNENVQFCQNCGNKLY